MHPLRLGKGARQHTRIPPHAQRVASSGVARGGSGSTMPLVHGVGPHLQPKCKLGYLESIFKLPGPSLPLLLSVADRGVSVGHAIAG